MPNRVLHSPLILYYSFTSCVRFWNGWRRLSFIGMHMALVDLHSLTPKLKLRKHLSLAWTEITRMVTILANFWYILNCSETRTVNGGTQRHFSPECFNWFRLFEVLWKLCKWIPSYALKFVSVRSFLGNFSLLKFISGFLFIFRNTSALLGRFTKTWGYPMIPFGSRKF